MAVNLNAPMMIPMQPLNPNLEVVRKQVNLQIWDGGKMAWEGQSVSNAATFGALPLSHTCRELEAIAKTGSVAGTRELAQEARSRYAEARADLLVAKAALVEEIDPA